MAAQDPRVEIFYGGTWHDVTAADEVYVRDAIVMGHGHTAELSGTNPDQLTCTLKSVAGKYNPQNPASPLYGQIGVNTPIRVRMGASDYRSHVEATEWKPGRVLAEGVDAWTELSGHGTLTRIGQGDPTKQSALYRHLITTDPLAYWPMEEESDSAGGFAVTPATPQIEKSNTPNSAVSPGRGDLAAWLPAGFHVSDRETGGGGRLDCYLPTNTASSSICMEWVRRAGAQTDPSDPAGLHRIGWVDTATSVGYTVEMYYRFGGVAELSIVKWDSGTTDLLTFSGGSLAEYPWTDTFAHWRLLAVENGANVDIELWINATLVASVTDIGESIQPLSRVLVDVDKGEGAFGHIAVWIDDVPDVLDNAIAAFGYQTELAGQRFERLCLEEEIPSIIVGDEADTQRMGPQHYDTIGNQFKEIALTDNALIHDSRGQLGLTMRTGRSLLNQTPALTLDYAAGHISPPLGPVVDDKGIRNDLTAKRRSGSEYRVIKTTGRRNINRPEDDPDGVGRYAHTHAINPENDEALPAQANWQLAAGTVDDIRWNSITVDLVANPSLAAAAAAVDIGDRITVDNPPIDYTPDMIDAVVIGTSEEIHTHRRSITYVCVPATVYTAGEYTDGVSPDPGAPIRYNPRDSETNASFDAGTDTALEVIDNTGGALWSTIASGFDIRVAGVRLRVTAVSAPTGSVQTLTVDATPVNGIVRTIPAGTRVELWAQARYAL